MNPDETEVKAAITINDKKYGLAFFDSINYNLPPAQDMKRRYEMIETFAKSLERQIVQELGLDLNRFIVWKETARR